MVTIAHDTEDSVKGVTEKVESGASDVGEVARFASELRAQVEALARGFKSIEGTLKSVAEIGEQNIAHIATLTEGLDEIFRD
jgi:methyl-accepting chemotaxis protein